MQKHIAPDRIKCQGRRALALNLSRLHSLVLSVLLCHLRVIKPQQGQPTQPTPDMTPHDDLTLALRFTDTGVTTEVTSTRNPPGILSLVGVDGQNLAVHVGSRTVSLAARTSALP